MDNAREVECTVLVLASSGCVDYIACFTKCPLPSCPELWPVTGDPSDLEVSFVCVKCLLRYPTILLLCLTILCVRSHVT